MNICTRILSFAAISVLGHSALAAIIVDNDFESVSPGTYDGGTVVTDGVTAPSTDGQAFGATATLGNASGAGNTTVSATSGVNGGAGATQDNMVMRSRSTADLTKTTSFSAYFLFESTSNFGEGNGFVGLGWGRADNRTFSDSSGIDGNNPFNRAQNNRFQFGLRKNGVADAELIVFGQLNTTAALTGSGGDTLSATLSDNTWYQLSGDITFNSDGASSTFDVSDIAVRDWGSDGLTGGSTVMSLASQTGIDEGFGQNFDSDPDGYAVLTGHAGVGAGTFDNFAVIPEPSALALTGLALAALALFRRRKT